MRDTMGFMLLIDGQPTPSDFTDDEFSAAIDKLQRASSTTARSASSPATTTSTT